MAWRLLPALLLSLGLASAFDPWEPDFRLTRDPSWSYTPYNNARCIACKPGGAVHVVWYDGRTGQCEIYHKLSTDNGATWTADQRITNTPGNSDYPSVTLQDSFVHVVWMENDGGEWEVYYVRSTDYGATWSEETPLTNAAEYQWFPCVAAGGNNVYTVWYDTRNGGNGEVYLRRSTDAGATWEPEARLTNEPNSSCYASVSAVDSLVHVVWSDTRTYFDIWYKRSTDFGATWTQDIQLTTDPGASDFPASWTEGPDIYVVFDDNRAGNSEIFFKHSSDNGLSWSEDVRLTNAAGSSSSAEIMSSGDHLHVVWQDQRDGGSPEIYYKNSDNKGLTWNDDVRLTSDTARSLLPCVATSDSVVHVVWEDTRDGNLEIYYKRNRRGNVGTEETPSAERQTPNVGPTIIRGALNLQSATCNLQSEMVLMDISGRNVLDLRAGANDVSRLAPGVYFVVEHRDRTAVGGKRSAVGVRKVIVQR
jgi:hypothetical protein